MLLDGNKILAGSLFGRNSYLYNLSNNTWGSAIPKFYNDRSQEETWAILPDGKVLVYDLFRSVSTGGGYAETFDPGTSTWSSVSPSDGNANGSIPQLSSSALGFEIGGTLRLCDGRMFHIGGTGHTAFYAPSTNTWAAGPDIPGGYIVPDGPAAILPNCHVILAANINSPGATSYPFNAPTKLFDFDPVANTITDITSSLPTNLKDQLNTVPAYVTRMLMLPNGQMLFGDSYNQLWVYTPDGAPAPALRPVIRRVTYQGGGKFLLTGLRITGQSAGATYGDDAEMDENYPIVRFQNLSGTFYGRTTQWSTTHIATGNSLVTANFSLPTGMRAGKYLMTVSAAGIQSLPTLVSITLTQILGQ